MKKISFGNLKKREKVLAIFALTICGYLLISKLIIEPSFKSLNEITEKYESKILLLSKYDDFVSNEEWYTDRLSKLDGEFNLLQAKILNLETEELASAKLQELVKNIARRNGLSISRSIAAKNMVIKEDPHLVFISANFEINDIRQMEKLKKFIYDIEYNKDKLFFVNDIKVKGIGVDEIQGVSVITSLAVIAKISKK